MRRTKGRRSALKTVLLITNGQLTERQYLSELVRRIDRKRISARVAVKTGDPLSVLKELRRPRSDVSEFDEVWIVVDHDGQDRGDFLAACKKASTRSTRVIGVVSVPCFEVWLNAHYGPVRNYQDQRDAQRHYRELTGLGGKQAKLLPDGFPWDSAQQACYRSRLPGTPLPPPGTQGSCPSTTMPHLLASLGLVVLPD